MFWVWLVGKNCDDDESERVSEHGKEEKGFWNACENGI